MRQLVVWLLAMCLKLALLQLEVTWTPSETVWEARLSEHQRNPGPIPVWADPHGWLLECFCPIYSRLYYVVTMQAHLP